MLLQSEDKTSEWRYSPVAQGGGTHVHQQQQQKRDEEVDQWAEPKKPLEPEVTRPTGRVNDKLPEKEKKKEEKIPSL